MMIQDDARRLQKYVPVLSRGRTYSQNDKLRFVSGKIMLNTKIFV